MPVKAFKIMCDEEFQWELDAMGIALAVLYCFISREGSASVRINPQVLTDVQKKIKLICNSTQCKILYVIRHRQNHYTLYRFDKKELKVTTYESITCFEDSVHAKFAEKVLKEAKWKFNRVTYGAASDRELRHKRQKTNEDIVYKHERNENIKINIKEKEHCGPFAFLESCRCIASDLKKQPDWLLKKHKIKDIGYRLAGATTLAMAMSMSDVSLQEKSQKISNVRSKLRKISEDEWIKKLKTADATVGKI